MFKMKLENNCETSSLDVSDKGVSAFGHILVPGHRQIMSGSACSLLFFDKKITGISWIEGEGVLVKLWLHCVGTRKLLKLLCQSKFFKS